MKNGILIALAALALNFVGERADAQSRQFNVLVDTTPVQGQAGYLALDFIDGNGLPDNIVGISGISTDGVLGTLSVSGDVTGDLSSGSLVLADSAFYNSALQSFVFGESLNFTVSATTEGPGAAFPDAFTFFILDGDQAPYGTSDPTGADALLSLELTGEGAEPVIYSSDFATVTVQGAFEIDRVEADPDRLWPPNGKFVEVALTVVPETGDLSGADCEITQVTSDEPPVDDDFRMIDPLVVELRARRWGSGNGRVYTVEVACSGPAGEDTGSAEVVVPHDQGRR